MNHNRRQFLKQAATNIVTPIAASLAITDMSPKQFLHGATVSNNFQTFTLTHSGTAQASIVIPDDASQAVCFAADELCRYIREISGASLPIRTFDPSSSERVLFVGCSSDVGMLLSKEKTIELPKEGTDEFSIAVTKDITVLCGGSERATLFATYQFLEDLGCRWLAPSQDYLPRQQTIEIPLSAKRVTPAMKWRVLNVDSMPSTIEFIDWFAKQKFNVLFPHPIELIRRMSSEQREALERRGLSVMGGGHSPAYFLPIEQYSAAHPEWFSLINGVRSKPGDWPWQICYSNDEAVGEFIRNCIQFLRAYPFVDSLVLWANDSPSGWCECDPCRRLEPNPDRIDPAFGVPDRSVTYFRWVKMVADAIHREMPNKRVLFGPYYNLMTFPEDSRVLPSPESHVMLDDYKQCYRHSLADSCNRPTQEKLLHEWLPHYHDTTASWVYYNTRVCGIPFGLLTRIAKDMRYLAARGIDGFMNDVGFLEAPNLSVMFGQDSLMFYVLAKLSWSPSLDLHNVVVDFTNHSYGSAAQTMLDFHELLDVTTYGFGEPSLEPEDKVNLKYVHTGFFMSPRAYIPNRQRLEELRSLVTKAFEESTDVAVRQRIQPLLSGMIVAEYLWDAEMLPAAQRLIWIPKIRQLAAAYLQPQYDSELSYDDRKESIKTRLQIVLDGWVSEASKPVTP